MNESTVISIALSDNNLQRSLPDNMMTLPDLLSFSVPGNSLGGLYIYLYGYIVFFIIYNYLSSFFLLFSSFLLYFYCSF